MDENIKKWPQTETGSQTGAFTLQRSGFYNFLYIYKECCIEKKLFICYRKPNSM